MMSGPLSAPDRRRHRSLQHPRNVPPRQLLRRPRRQLPRARLSTPAVQPVVDVEGVLEGLSAKASQPLNWRTSIVDLMKLLDLDSSLAHRQQLAKELGYTGDANDSAAMNIWLHKQVMTKLAQSGGKVPESLKH